MTHGYYTHIYIGRADCGCVEALANAMPAERRLPRDWLLRGLLRGRLTKVL